VAGSRRRIAFGEGATGLTLEYDLRDKTFPLKKGPESVRYSQNTLAGPR